MKRGVLLLLTLALSWSAFHLSRWVGAREQSPAAFLDDERLRPANINITDLHPCAPNTDPICDAVVSLNTTHTAVSYTALRITKPLRLGDVIARWGPPSHVQMEYRLAGQVGHYHPIVVAYLYFNDGLTLLLASRDDARWRLSPTMQVEWVEYHAANLVGSIIPIGTPRWQGFGEYVPER